MSSYQSEGRLDALAKRLEISVSQETLLAADQRRSTPIKPSLSHPRLSAFIRGQKCFPTKATDSPTAFAKRSPIKQSFLIGVHRRLKISSYPGGRGLDALRGVRDFVRYDSS
jgi:hypothetical protein